MLTDGAAFWDEITWASFVHNMYLVLGSAIVSLPILPAVKRFFLESHSDRLYVAGRIASAAACVFLLMAVSMLLVDSTNNVFLYWRF